MKGFIHLYRGEHTALVIIAAPLYFDDIDKLAALGISVEYLF